MADCGAWMVIIGVAGEGLEIAIKVAERSKSTSERFRKWLDKAKLSKKCLDWCATHELMVELFGAAFWVLVVIGLMIELKGTHEAKKIDDADNAQLHLRASILESNNVVLFTIGERAKESAARATEEAEKAKMEREKAESGRLELEKEVATLRIKIQDRRITEAQKRLMLGQLKPSPGEYVVFNFSTGDPEATTFAADIAGVLKTAGYEIRDFDKQAVLSMESMAPSTGLSVLLNPRPLPRSTSRLQAAFKTALIDVRWIGIGSDTNRIYVVVGKKI